MKLTISTTPEQDEALNRLNSESNPKGPAPVDEFTTSVILTNLDSLVLNYKQRDVDAAKSKLQEVISKLQPADLAQVTAIAEKYANQ